MRFRPIFTVVWLSLQTAACGLESGGPAAPAGGNPPPAVPGGIASGSRLKPEFVTSADGAQIPLGSFWDAARSERCSFGADAVGVQRCMPFVGAVASYLFSDPKCMQPLFFAEPARTTCSPYGYTLQADLCGNNTAHRYAFFKLTPTANRPPAAYARGADGACTLQAVPMGVLLLATPIAPEQFASGMIGAAR